VAPERKSRQRGDTIRVFLSKYNMAINFVAALAIYLIGFVLFTYACIVGDPNTSPFARFLSSTLPDILIVRPLTLLIGVSKLRRLFFLVNDWGLVSLYLAIVLGSWSVMFAYGYPLLVKYSHIIPPWHRYVLTSTAAFPTYIDSSMFLYGSLSICLLLLDIVVISSLWPVCLVGEKSTRRVQGI